MDPCISASRNTDISFHSYIVFKPLLLNQSASAKDMTQSLHTEPDFEKKIAASMHCALCSQVTSQPHFCIHIHHKMMTELLILFQDSLT